MYCCLGFCSKKTISVEHTERVGFQCDLGFCCGIEQQNTITAQVLLLKKKKKNQGTKNKYTVLVKCWHIRSQEFTFYIVSVGYILCQMSTTSLNDWICKLYYIYNIGVCACGYIRTYSVCPFFCSGLTYSCNFAALKQFGNCLKKHN